MSIPMKQKDESDMCPGDRLLSRLSLLNQNNTLSGYMWCTFLTNVIKIRCAKGTLLKLIWISFWIQTFGNPHIESILSQWKLRNQQKKRSENVKSVLDCNCSQPELISASVHAFALTVMIQNNPDTITHIISLCGDRSSCDTEWKALLSWGLSSKM